MEQKSTIIKAIAEKLRITYYDKHTIACGNCNGYTVVAGCLVPSGRKDQIVLSLCASCKHEPVSKELIDSLQLPKDVSIQQDAFRIYLETTNSKTASEIADNLVHALFSLMGSLNENLCPSCDEYGIEGKSDAYISKGKVTILNESSLETYRKKITTETKDNSSQNELFIPGLIGAVASSLVALMITFLLARFIGETCMVSGIIVGLSIVTGYKRFGRKYSKKSCMVCVVIAAVMSYVAFILATTVMFYASAKDMGLDHTLAFSFTHVKSHYESMGRLSRYYSNMILMFITCVGSTLAVIYAQHTSAKEGNKNLIKLS